MTTFETIAKIKVRVEGLPAETLNEFSAEFDANAQWLRFGFGRCVALFDVDDAEKAVAWLKAHGVEQEPKAPERDTEKALASSDPIHVTIARQQAKSALDLFDNIDVDGLREDECALLDEICAAIRSSLGR